MRAFTLPRGGGGLRRDLTRTINHRATDSDSFGLGILPWTYF